MNLRETAFELAATAHAGQVDKAGRPYIEHPLKVASGFVDDTRFIAALLHDVVEDSDISLDDLKSKGLSSEVINAVDAITKRPDESYDGYLRRVKINSVARDVKLADLKHNMDLSRISNPKDSDYQHIKKYQYAVKYLSE